MAAPNRSEILDPALLRPRRFDRQVVVDRPDINGWEAILNVRSQHVFLGPDVDLRKHAALTPGFVGADFARLVNEATLLAAGITKRRWVRLGFDEAVDRAVGGLERKSRLMNVQDKEIVAFHEAGHAIVAESMKYVDPFNKISVICPGIAALAEYAPGKTAKGA